MPKTRDLAIFVAMTDKTDCFTLCTCAWGIYVDVPDSAHAYKQRSDILAS